MKRITEICEIPLEDGVNFKIISVTNIMSDFECPGIRMMFEDRTISLLSYNTETLLAEKMQTIIARSLANTRMREFYDVCGIVR